MMHLGPNDVHIWVTHSEKLLGKSSQDRCHDLLCEHERDRYNRFVFEKDRHIYLVAHAQVRSLLSFYSDVNPADWRFVLNRYGRPSISEQHNTVLHFNLSHTDGLIVSAFARQEEIGIDVENTSLRDSILDIAGTVFARSELDDLNRLPAAMQRQRFFEIWTLKEAYIKAKGMGLSLALDLFWFKLNREGIKIEFDERLNDTPETWQFEMYQPTANHQMALAVRQSDAKPMTVRVREFLPE